MSVIPTSCPQQSDRSLSLIPIVQRQKPGKCTSPDATSWEKQGQEGRQPRAASSASAGVLLSDRADRQIHGPTAYLSPEPSPVPLTLWSLRPHLFTSQAACFSTVHFTAQQEKNQLGASHTFGSDQQSQVPGQGRAKRLPEDLWGG